MSTLTERHQYHAEIFDQLYSPYFSYEEMRCKCGSCDPDYWNYATGEFRAFMEVFVHLREALAFPFIPTSGHRCSQYNDLLYVRKGKKPGTHLEGPHTRGAGDLKVSFERSYALIALATAMHLGVGIKQHDDVADRYVHIDNLGSRLWTYP